MKILYCSPKQNYEIDLPFFSTRLSFLLKGIKIKEVPKENYRGTSIRSITCDEFSGGINLDKKGKIVPACPKQFKKYLDKLNQPIKQIYEK